jgi:AAA domain
VIRYRREELLRFHARHFLEEAENGHYENSNGRHGELTDEEVIRLAGKARNSAKFEALYRGDATGYDSHSEADQALISLLAFYTQDEEQLDRLYRQSGLYRNKWTERPDYRRRTTQRALSNLTETYNTSDDGALMVVGKGDRSLASPSPSSYIERDVGTEAEDQESSVAASPSPYKDKGRGRKPEVVRFSDMKVPGPRRYLLKDLVLSSYVTLLYGDGGVAKSLLALALAVAVSGGSEEWLGREVENGPVLYLDFELDAEEQARRVHQLCRGAGLAEPPDGLLYMSALGHTAREAFTAALEACEEHGVKLLVLDSLGPALQGDAEASRDVISFFQRALEPFRQRYRCLDNRSSEQGAGRPELSEQGRVWLCVQKQPGPQCDSG